jgi:hypothetical protein
MGGQIEIFFIYITSCNGCFGASKRIWTEILEFFKIIQKLPYKYFSMRSVSVLE